MPPSIQCFLHFSGPEALRCPLILRLKEDFFLNEIREQQLTGCGVLELYSKAGKIQTLNPEAPPGRAPCSSQLPLLLARSWQVHKEPIPWSNNIQHAVRVPGLGGFMAFFMGSLWIPGAPPGPPCPALYLQHPSVPFGGSTGHGDHTTGMELGPKPLNITILFSFNRFFI